MTNRGLFGLPQGQRSGSGGEGYTGRLMTRAVHRPGGGGSNTDYSQANIIGPLSAGLWYQIMAAAPYDLYISGLYSEYNSTPVTQTWFVGVGPAGSEKRRAYVRLATTAYEQRPFTRDIFVPAGSRVAVQPGSGASGSYYMVLSHYAAAKPGKQIEIVGSSVAQTGSTWTEIATAPPFANGGWITDVQIVGASLGRQAVRFGFGSAGSEVDVTAYMECAGLAGGGGLGGPMSIPPIWWPPNTRLAFQGSSGSQSSSMFYIVAEAL